MRPPLLPALVSALLIATPAIGAEPLLPPGAAHVNRSVEDVVEFDVALSPSKVDAFYRAALTKGGWKPGDTVSYGTTLVLDVRRPPKARGRVTIAPKGNNLTHVTLSLVE